MRPPVLTRSSGGKGVGKVFGPPRFYAATSSSADTTGPPPSVTKIQADIVVGMALRARRLLSVLISDLVTRVAVVELARSTPKVVGVAAVTHIAGMADVMTWRDRALPKEECEAMESPILAPIAHPGISVRVTESLPEPTAIGIDHAPVFDALLVVRI